MPKKPESEKKKFTFFCGQCTESFYLLRAKKAELLKKLAFNSSKIPAYDSTGTVFYI